MRIPPRRRTRWEAERQAWIRDLSAPEIIRVTIEVARRGKLYDENEGDRAETLAAIAWLASGGEGEEYGRACVAATALGMGDWTTGRSRPS